MGLDTGRVSWPKMLKDKHQSTWEDSTSPECLGLNGIRRTSEPFVAVLYCNKLDIYVPTCLVPHKQTWELTTVSRNHAPLLPGDMLASSCSCPVRVVG